MSRAEEELVQVAHAWDRAMVGNDADAIGEFMADDWVIIGSDGELGTRAAFLDLVRSGELSHDVMASEEFRVRVYGDSAVATAKGTSGGTFRGRPFFEHERWSCVFVRRGGEWKCVLTHLSRLAPPPGV
ncbi:MAG: nuclear transport factor 2 family protein [Gemmatimonadales bacterium]